jgi:hypothetical protein
MSGRTYRVKVNDDDSVTFTYGDYSSTFPALRGQVGRVIRHMMDGNRPGHDTLIRDDGHKATLNCACQVFTAICDTGTAEERVASVEYAYETHANKVDHARDVAQFKALFGPKDSR